MNTGNIGSETKRYTKLKKLIGNVIVLKGITQSPYSGSLP